MEFVDSAGGLVYLFQFLKMLKLTKYLTSWALYLLYSSSHYNLR
jgi:hypothetical protein